MIRNNGTRNKWHKGSGMTKNQLEKIAKEAGRLSADCKVFQNQLILKQKIFRQISPAAEQILIDFENIVSRLSGLSTDIKYFALKTNQVKKKPKKK